LQRPAKLPHSGLALPPLALPQALGLGSAPASLPALQV